MKKLKNIRISGAATSANAIILGMGDAVEKAEFAQLDLEAKLAKDLTKTPEAQQLFASKAGLARIKTLLSSVEKRQKDIRTSLNGYATKVDKQATSNGTTDLLILMAHATALKDASLSDILTLARDGEMDVIRAALIVPELRLNPKIKAGRDQLMEILTQNVLGDDYDKMTLSREQNQAANKLETALLQKHVEYDNSIKGIESMIVAAA